MSDSDTKQEEHDILVFAAAMIDQYREEYSCNAIDRAAEYLGNPQYGIVDREGRIRYRYARMISPGPHSHVEPTDFDKYGMVDICFDGYNQLRCEVSEKAQEVINHRVMALLMAAQMARTGDL